MIDTRRNTQAGGSLSHASVRIYVCEPCAVELGEAMGLVKRDEYESVVDKLRDSDLELARVKHDLAEAQDAQTRVVDADEIIARIEKLTKPKPAAKKADVPQK